MEKVALLYGPVGGSTARVAKRIAMSFGSEYVDLIPVQEVTSEHLSKYNQFICGIPTIGKDTWDSKIDQEDWATFFPILKNIDLTNKTFACFGLGDHLQYPSHFVDSLGQLVSVLESNNGRCIGQVPIESYEFQESVAIKGNNFVGLPIDEDFEPEKTIERVENWVSQIKKEF